MQPAPQNMRSKNPNQTKSTNPDKKGDALVRCKELAVRNREWCSEKRKIVMMALENTMGTATPTVKNKEHTGDE